MRARPEKLIDGFDSKTKKAVIQTATDEFNLQKKDFLDMVFDIILWTLHEECGFGIVRMRRFYKAMFERCYNDRERYGLHGCERSRRPMSERIRRIETENGMSYPEYVKMRLKGIGWDTRTVEQELYEDYERKGGF